MEERRICTAIINLSVKFGFCSTNRWTQMWSGLRVSENRQIKISPKISLHEEAGSDFGRMFTVGEEPVLQLLYPKFEAWGSIKWTSKLD